ncbi:MAG: response regulator, partial [Saprospiraceae bacterium]|nr:response regulator [Saprospiraceae bacterium]
QGVYRYDRQKDVVENYLLKYIDYKFPDYFIIRDIWQDSRNNLWIAGWFHGLFRIDLETNILSKYDPLPSTDGMVVNKAIRAIYEDTQQGIWIGTRNGLLKYREITDDFVVYKHLNSDPESMSENTSFCIYQDSLGYIWSGSYGGGLNRLDTATGKFIHFTVREGLLSNNIFSLLPDDQGDLWMLSFEGITRFNPYTYEVINFTMENGLASNRYDGFLYGKSRFTDLLFFMGTSGIDILHPNRVKVSDYKPPVILTNFSLFNEPVSINIGVDSDAFMLDQSIVFAEQIGLNYDHRVFTIDYAALDYDGSEKIQYAYQLKGFDKDWQYVHNKRSATYTNLDPGQYEFKVRSTNSDGIWNDQYRSLFLTVASPWWTTWLAYLVYLILIVGLIYGLWYYQRRRWMLQTALHIQEGETKRLRDIDVLRTNLYTNITHEFRTPLTIISGVAKLIRDKPKEWVQQGSHTIEAQSQKLLAMVSRVLELQKIESGKLIYQPVQSDMIGFINYILEPFEFQAQSKKLQFEIAHQREYLIMDFDPQKLEIVVSNIVSNAMKFTSAGQITVSTFQNSSGGFCIRIVDTGIGINSNNLNLIFDRFYQVDESLSGTIGGTGIGLALVKELLPLMSGKVDVESNPGKGTTFLITLQMTTEATLRSVDYSFSQATTNLEDQIPTLLRIKSDINQPTLLIIEDNPDVRSYLIAILGDSYRVLEAQDGEQGIKVARDKIPELIISDVMMPGYDGYAVCEAVHNDLLTSHIPIILLAAKV